MIVSRTPYCSLNARLMTSAFSALMPLICVSFCGSLAMTSSASSPKRATMRSAMARPTFGSAPLAR